MPLRILFFSVHTLLDPSSGAARTTRDLFELLATRGHDGRALTTGVLDYETETDAQAVIAGTGAVLRRVAARLTDGSSRPVLDWTLGRIRGTTVPTASSRADRAPSEAEAALLLDLADQILGRFRPHVLWTYGGHPVTAEVMRRARVRGIPSVFHLHNFAYPHRAAFAEAAAVLVPSAFSQQYHARKLGLCCTALPPPLPAPPPAGDAPAPMTRYVTFVNPEPIKGVTVFARIAAELECRRPDIPLLVVEGRGGMNWLERVPLDLSGLTNLHRMPSTPDPDRFYRASRLVLVPSLCRESFGRVAAEALQRGLPVLASDRGALPETLGDAGFLFALPDRCTPRTPAVPSAREVAPWVATIERIWDDPAFEAEHQARARNEASRWDRDIIYMRYEDFLYNLAIIRKK